jgi:hypothetical protein
MVSLMVRTLARAGWEIRFKDFFCVKVNEDLVSTGFKRVLAYAISDHNVRYFGCLMARYPQEASDVNTANFKFL